MGEAATIGLDIAKNVFQVYGADADGRALFNRKLSRQELVGFFKRIPHCTVGVEACATSYYWARCIAELGHDVRLIHPRYVKPFVKRGKTDASDAEAINEALTRRTMRFVPVKSAEQQASAMAFRTRDMFVRQRTQASNALRSHLSEMGIIAETGRPSLKLLMKAASDEDDIRLPPSARFALRQIVSHIEFLQARIMELEREIRSRARGDEVAKRLMTIPGVGPLIASAVRFLAPDPSSFKSARHFAAWIGLTPKSNSSGERHLMGHISKMGNAQLRFLMFSGAASVIGHLKSDDKSSWLGRLKQRRPFKVVAVAMANKMARMIWALSVKGGVYRERGQTAPYASMVPR